MKDIINYRDRYQLHEDAVVLQFGCQIFKQNFALHSAAIAAIHLCPGPYEMTVLNSSQTVPLSVEHSL